jgi:luciferase family oxidoreductase group 1
MPLRIGVLDQSPVSQGGTGAQALRNTIDLARHADRLGFHRYWVAEHHGGPMLAGPAPEVLIGPIAAATTRLRVGSGGVMLPHYSPLKVAEAFSVLAGLFGDRIDLAIGRAPGTDGLTSFALQRDRRQAAPDDFPAQLAELLGYLDDTIPEEHPFRRLTDLPGRPERPEPWLLGSSAQSGIWAAELGLPYAFADFISPDGAWIADRYRREFTEGVREDAPRVVVGLAAVCAETTEEAERLAASSRMAIAKLRAGELIAVPPPEEALDFLAAHEPGPRERPRRVIVGDPETVRRGITAAAAEYGAAEALIVTITYDHEARKRSYELIAEAFGLPAAAPDEAAAVA